MRQLEKEGASPGFHKVEFTELPSSTRNCTKIHRIMQQQPNTPTSSKNQNLALTGPSMGNSQIWVGKGDMGMTLARRACAMHSELNWRTAVPLPFTGYFSSQRCPLSPQHCAISSKGAIPVHCKEHSWAHHSESLLPRRNGSALIVSRDLKADTQLRIPFNCQECRLRDFFRSRTN